MLCRLIFPIALSVPAVHLNLSFFDYLSFLSLLSLSLSHKHTHTELMSNYIILDSYYLCLEWDESEDEEEEE